MYGIFTQLRGPRDGGSHSYIAKAKKKITLIFLTIIHIIYFFKYYCVDKTGCKVFTHSCGGWTFF